MAGKRFTVRSRSIRWRQGRYKGRRGSSPRRPPKPRPVLDVVIAVGASLIAAFFVLCMAFSLLGAYGTPLYIGYADVWHAVEHLRQVMDSGEWRDARFAHKNAVT